MVRAQGEADGEFAKLGFKSEINIEFFDLLLYKASLGWTMIFLSILRFAGLSWKKEKLRDTIIVCGI